MVEIRRASIADVEELIRLRCVFLGTVNDRTEPPEGYVEILRQYLHASMADGSFAAWLAEEGGRIVATGSVCYYRITPNYSNPTGEIAYIQNMFTLPEYRRKGLASALFARLIDEARARGVNRIALHATEEGRKLYMKFGFQPQNNEMILKLG